MIKSKGILQKIQDLVNSAILSTNCQFFCAIQPIRPEKGIKAYFPAYLFGKGDGTLRKPKKRWIAFFLSLLGVVFCGGAAAADGGSFDPLPGVAAASFAPYRLSCTLINPLPDAELTDGYGWRYHPITGSLDFHYGNDLAAPAGTEIYAAADGTVVTAAQHDSYGNYLVIQHSGTLRTLYAHCQSLLVSAGETVSAGEVVALVGATGEATGPHLHFEVIASGTRFSPDWVQFAGEGG